MLNYHEISGLVLNEMVQGLNFANAMMVVNILHCDNELTFLDKQVVKEYLIQHLDVLDVLIEKVENNYKRGFASIDHVHHLEKQIEAIETLLTDGTF